MQVKYLKPPACNTFPMILEIEDNETVSFRYHQHSVNPCWPKSHTLITPTLSRNTIFSLSLTLGRNFSRVYGLWENQGITGEERRGEERLNDQHNISSCVTRFDTFKSRKYKLHKQTFDAIFSILFDFMLRCGWRSRVLSNRLCAGAPSQCGFLTFL